MVIEAPRSSNILEALDEPTPVDFFEERPVPQLVGGQRERFPGYKSGASVTAMINNAALTAHVEIFGTSVVVAFLGTYAHYEGTDYVRGFKIASGRIIPYIKTILVYTVAREAMKHHNQARVDSIAAGKRTRLRHISDEQAGLLLGIIKRRHGSL